MIKNLIFDLGGVIIKEIRSTHNQEFLSWYFGIPLKQADDLWQNGDSLCKGEETTDQFLNRIGQILNINIDIIAVKRSWKEYFAERSSLDEELLSLIEKLRRKYKVYILSDTEEIHDNTPLKRKIFREFDRVFKSFEEGVRKPEKEAFLNVLDKIKAKPETCLFIDDKEENIRGAKKVGIEGIVYINLEQLKNQLVELKIGSE